LLNVGRMQIAFAARPQCAFEIEQFSVDDPHFRREHSFPRRVVRRLAQDDQGTKGALALWRCIQARRLIEAFEPGLPVSAVILVEKRGEDDLVDDLQSLCDSWLDLGYGLH